MVPQHSQCYQSAEGAGKIKVKLVAEAAHAPANPTSLIEQPTAIARHSGDGFFVKIVSPLFND